MLGGPLGYLALRARGERASFTAGAQMFGVGIAVAIIGAIVGAFGLIVGLEVPGLGFRVMHLPSAIAGGVIFLAGVILVAAGWSGGAAQNTAPQAVTADKWAALVQYDDDIARAAESARALGPAYEARLASSYLALNDKTYLPTILQKLKEERSAELITEVPDALIDAVLVVDNMMKAAVLRDGRAIGWTDDGYAIFESMYDYREAVNAMRDQYSPMGDIETKLAFYREIEHLHSKL